MTSTAMIALQQRLAAVHERIDAAARRSGRVGGDVRLIGVSKTVTRAEVDEIYAAGLRDFGENRVQNALETFALPRPDDLCLHMIGNLQLNKARFIPGNFGYIQTLDRTALVKELGKRCVAAEVNLPALIQVNIAEEEQKHGCDVADLPALIDATLSTDGLELRGFMMMAPLGTAAEQARPHFVAMYELAEQMRSRYPDVDLAQLSMGMSNDFEAAIEEGSTMVRVGRAIFSETYGT